MARGPTNTMMLDDGTFGRNLQIGQKPNYSGVNDPTVILFSDGGAAKYQMVVDGVDLGIFDTLQSPVAATLGIPTEGLADGEHTMSGRELSPNPDKPVTPFLFIVDTHVPAVPSVPVISSYSDSGVPGDHITKYRNVNFHGTCEPGCTVQLYNGPTGIAGSGVSADGNWSATTISLADGSYQVQALAVSRSGNRSGLSGPCALTVRQDQAAGTPGAPGTLPPEPTYWRIRWSAPLDDGGALVTGYNLYRGEAPGSLSLLASLGSGTFFIDYSIYVGRTYYYQVAAVNSAGEGPRSSVIVTD